MRAFLNGKEIPLRRVTFDDICNPTFRWQHDGEPLPPYMIARLDQWHAESVQMVGDALKQAPRWVSLVHAAIFVFFVLAFSAFIVGAIYLIWIII